VINAFTCGNRFLSNFYPSEVEYDGVSYPTIEHAFQAAKSTDPLVREMVRAAGSPAEAKKRGRQLTLRADWDACRIDVMRELLAYKFAPGSHLADRLIATGNQELVEGNWWGDRFWGVCEGRGENHLGKLLMEIRDIIR
jgi:ribA/ribD-fused uncharacterized protein